MHITEGEGTGSVVETHATPLGLAAPTIARAPWLPGATIAYSERPGFQVARRLSPLVRPGIRHTARKLWVDDLAYAGAATNCAGAASFPAESVTIFCILERPSMADLRGCSFRTARAVDHREPG